MEVTAKARYVIVSPKKVWRITRELRGMDYKKTQELLREMNLKAARILEKLLKSAFYNAQQKDANLSEEDLFVKEIAVTGGPAYKRMMPRAQGRADVIRKQTSHINVVLANKEEA